jgi:hypothetical protein
MNYDQCESASSCPSPRPSPRGRGSVLRYTHPKAATRRVSSCGANRGRMPLSHRGQLGCRNSCSRSETAPTSQALHLVGVDVWTLHHASSSTKQKAVDDHKEILFMAVNKQNSNAAFAFPRHPEPPSIVSCNGYEQVCAQGSGNSFRNDFKKPVTDQHVSCPANSSA